MVLEASRGLSIREAPVNLGLFALGLRLSLLGEKVPWDEKGRMGRQTNFRKDTRSYWPPGKEAAGPGVSGSKYQLTGECHPCGLKTLL